ncbi:MAG: RNA polymerase sigma factor [Bacteroidia bacterium]|nr:RNA polymerase sigma factor [Bacteroidia bacterium]
MNISVEIIEGCIRRKSSAESKLYKLIFSYLMGIAIRYAKSEDKAEDLVNMGFMKILNNLPKYDNSLPFKNWIRRIMVNTIIDEFRKEKKHKDNLEYVDEYGTYYEYSIENNAIQRMSANDILNLISKLPENTAKIFNLYVIDGFTHREIADMLDISEGTSKWHVNMAREKLKQMIVLQNMEIRKTE